MRRDAWLRYSYNILLVRRAGITAKNRLCTWVAHGQARVNVGTSLSAGGEQEDGGYGRGESSSDDHCESRRFVKFWKTEFYGMRRGQEYGDLKRLLC